MNKQKFLTDLDLALHWYLPQPEADEILADYQVGDMHSDGGAGDPRLVRQLLLGDEGVFLNPVQKLPLPLGHSPPPNKHKFNFLI